MNFFNIMSKILTKCQKSHFLTKYLILRNVRKAPDFDNNGYVRRIVQVQSIAMPRHNQVGFTCKTLKIMGNEWIKGHFATHDHLNKSGNFCATFPSSKSSTFPASTCHQLERSSGNFFSSCSDSNDARFSPSSMCYLKISK